MDRFVDVPGGRIFVEDEGAGPPVILVHAGVVDLRSWDAMVPHLVGAGFRTVRHDGRGFGRTVTEDVAFSNRADLIAVLDALGIERAALVGNSRGGQIAFDTAVERPERVVAVVGVGAGLGGYESVTSPEEQVLFDEGDRLEAADPPDPDAIVDFDVRVWLDGPGQPAERVAADVREAMRAMDRDIRVAGRTGGRPIVLDPPAEARLGDLRCPVLAVAGLLDFSYAADTARHLEARAPDARAMLVPGAAHMMGMERPLELARIVTDFLEPLRPWA